jgi:hypothetical protein
MFAEMDDPATDAEPFPQTINRRPSAVGSPRPSAHSISKKLFHSNQRSAVEFL